MSFSASGSDLCTLWMKHKFHMKPFDLSLKLKHDDANQLERQELNPWANLKIQSIKGNLSISMWPTHLTDSSDTLKTRKLVSHHYYNIGQVPLLYMVKASNPDMKDCRTS